MFLSFLSSYEPGKEWYAWQPLALSGISRTLCPCPWEPGSSTLEVTSVCWQPLSLSTSSPAASAWSDSGASRRESTRLTSPSKVYLTFSLTFRSDIHLSRLVVTKTRHWLSEGNLQEEAWKQTHLPTVHDGGHVTLHDGGWGDVLPVYVHQKDVSVGDGQGKPQI